MHKTIRIAAALGLMLTVGPAHADDKADCLKGIAKLKALKKPTERQRKQLADAEQEELENDWAECREILNRK